MTRRLALLVLAVLLLGNTSCGENLIDGALVAHAAATSAYQSLCLDRDSGSCPDARKALLRARSVLRMLGETPPPLPWPFPEPPEPQRSLSTTEPARATKKAAREQLLELERELERINTEPR